MGGKLAVIWQPFEAVIIGGAAIGAMIIGKFDKAAKGPAYKKDD